MKVKFFEIELIKRFGIIIGGISTALSLVLIFVELPTSSCIRLILAGIFMFSLLALYVGLWVKANQVKDVSIRVNRTKVNIRAGNIFEENDSLKLIAFNEYFDTKVDDNIISATSLNGIYLKKYLNCSIEELDERIRTDNRMKKLIAGVDDRNGQGKQVRYPLGTIYKNEDYLLLAFSKFDENNEAYLDSKGLWDCLVNMWKEIGISYAGQSISIPLLGSGITRKRGMNISEQELLELIILSLRVSGLQLNWNVKINIVIFPKNAEEISFYALKRLSD